MPGEKRKKNLGRRERKKNFANDVMSAGDDAHGDGMSKSGFRMLFVACLPLSASIKCRASSSSDLRRFVVRQSFGSGLGGAELSSLRAVNRFSINGIDAQ